MDERTRLLLDLPTELRGGRVTLRAITPDARLEAEIWEAISESRDALAQWMEWWTPDYDPDSVKLFARRSAVGWWSRSDFSFGIHEGSGERCLGCVGLHSRNWAVPEFEIGYWLRSSAQGRGLMTEAVSLARAFGFENLRANRLFIRCDARNERSAAVARRCGFLHEGTFRANARDPQGELRDTHYFGLTAPTK